jgi:ATP-dependent RNA helicase DeaD
MPSTESLENTPTVQFKDLIQQDLIINNLTEKMGFTDPTPIQKAVIPSILEGKDVCAGAKTGSGKTMAFILPIAQMIFEGRIKKALVLCPTRELALQIDEEAMRALDGQNQVVSIPLYGGVPLDQQLRALKTHKPSLYIATPGRTIDFMMEEALNFDEIELIVLDEADRMCDMGFSPQITQILGSLRSRKQSLMFSATMPKEANEIMMSYMKDPVKIQVDSPQKASNTIEHRVIYVSRRDKNRSLSKILEAPDQVTVIFCRTRKGADRLYEDLRRERHGVGILHAGYEMNEREKTIRGFRDGKITTLIATDVASRGLDIDTVTTVIHYEVPESLDDYIHRSGRSGRAGRKGVAYLLVDRQSSNDRRSLEEFSKVVKFETDPGSSGESSSEEDSVSGSEREDHRRSSDRGARSSRSSHRQGHRSSKTQESHSRRSDSRTSRRSESDRGRRSESGTENVRLHKPVKNFRQRGSEKSESASKSRNSIAQKAKSIMKMILGFSKKKS